MLGLLFVIAGGIAAYRLQGTGVFVPALINAIACLWGNGVMFNFKNDPAWPHNNWDRFVGGVAMLSSIGSLIFLIVSFVVK